VFGGCSHDTPWARSGIVVTTSDAVRSEGSKRTEPNDRALSGSRKLRGSFPFDHNRCIPNTFVLSVSSLGGIKPVAVAQE
jgi:hypothetical protein